MDVIEQKLNENIEQVKQISRKGLTDQALSVMDQLIGALPQYAGRLFREKAEIEYEEKREREALLDYVRAFEETGEAALLSSILEKFGGSDEAARLNLYRRNREAVKKYRYAFGDLPENPGRKVLWKDEACVVAYDEGEGRFETIGLLLPVEEEQRTTSVLMSNIVFMETISRVKRDVVQDNAAIPIYLYFDVGYSDVFFQLEPVSRLLEDKRLVFFFGKGDVRRFFSYEGSILPVRIYGDREGELNEVIAEITYEREKRKNAFKEQAEAYYEAHGEEVLLHIKEENPRVLFLTTQYSRPMCYHFVNLSRAMEAIGLETMVSIEEEPIYAPSALTYAKAFAEYKPDVIVICNHFRWEVPSFVPENLVVLTWIQDPIDGVMHPSTCAKLGSRDVLMNFILSYRRLLDNFPGKRMIKAPVPGNEEIYRPYQLTEADRDAYGADICFVCNQSDVEGQIRGAVMGLSDPWVQDVIVNVYHAYDRDAHEGRFLYSESEFADYIGEHIGGKENIHPHLLEVLSTDMFIWLNQRVLRSTLVDWIIEAGYTDIKLWGDEWLQIPRFSKYACGRAENGKVLSKILQASKIVMGNNSLTTAAARVWETLLSGGFYLSNDIPAEKDWCDLRKIIREEDVVFFHDRRDMVEKIGYYLSHDKERERMAEVGRKAALENMTFRRLAKRVVAEMPAILEEQGAKA